MADLTPLEKRRLEQVLGMESGYVLGFSNADFKELVSDMTGINVYETNEYTDIGTSKANRLSSFWKKEPNVVVAKLIDTLVELWKVDHVNNNTYDERVYEWYAECRKIVKRLNQDSNDEITVEAHFEKIQSQILQQIESAKFTIWVAVAWFTDRTLFDHLLVKKRQGLNIQLIIADDEINTQYGFDYESEFETYRIENFGKYAKNKVHNKFCVIDLKTVIQGSYNWTDNARFNSEDITILQGHEIAEKFAEQFIQIKTSKKVKSPKES